MPDTNHPVWKLREHSDEFAGRPAYTVFVAPGPDRTFQNAGNLLLSKEEAEDLQQKLAGAPQARDLTAEEYNRLQTFLMEWAHMDTEALYLADMVREKFGASSRRVPRG